MTDEIDLPIVVTGATGYLGGGVARRLAAAGVRQTMLVRDPARAPQLPGATVAQAAYGDRDATRRALSAGDQVLMVSASETPDRVEQHRAFVDAATDAGVGRLVYTSFYGAAPDSTFTLARDHWATEQHIRESGLSYTFLRDNLYADFLPAMAGSDGVIRGPAGDGRAAMVVRDDIVDAATAVLRNTSQHVGGTYNLTGPQALTLREAAAIASEITGRTFTYHDETLPEAYQSRASYGAPAWQVDAWVSTYLAIANGELETVTQDVASLTGRPATTLADLLRRGKDSHVPA
jgi:NAD(P)H dehydrogenase (quinone)